MTDVKSCRKQCSRGWTGDGTTWDALQKRIAEMMPRTSVFFTMTIAALLFIGMVLAWAPRAIAQSSTSARLTGSVTDPSGAVVPSAHITAENTGTKLIVAVESNDAGVMRSTRFLRAIQGHRDCDRVRDAGEHRRWTDSGPVRHAQPGLKARRSSRRP